MAPRRLFKVHELVHVESTDAGFEGCWCEAIVQRIVNVAPAPESDGAQAGAAAGAAAPEQEPRILYDVKYTQFVSDAGKPIVEAVCEARVRPVPPELVGYEASVGDFVDAFWRDGWWEGVVAELKEGAPDALVRFPSHSGQEVLLPRDDLRPILRMQSVEGPWHRKVRKEGGASASPDAEFEWTALDPVTHKLRLRTEPRRKRPASSHTAAPPTKQQRAREPFPQVPAAPTYYPSEEEFAEPFKYILRIKPEAEKYGICKIVPPPNWKPSWSIDSKNFTFDTRIQNVHQLQVNSPPLSRAAPGPLTLAVAHQERGEFLFWKRLKKSLAKRGTPLKAVPRLDGKQLDLFAMYRWVMRMGGSQKMEAAKWTQLGDELKVSATLADRPAAIERMYRTYLLKFEAEETENMRQEVTAAALSKDEKPTSTSAEGAAQSDATDAAGDAPAAAGAADAAKVPEKLDQRCEICFEATDPSNMLLCDGCDGGYHTFCLRPKVTVVPHGNWYCSRCKMEQVEEVMGDEPFGFEDGPQYSLTTFHTLADSYKQRWFSGGGASPDAAGIERDFWDIVEEGSAMHNVQVLYGADLPTLKHGSGFAVDPSDSYCEAPWNLNKMPTLPGSLLRHLDRTVSGLVAPWLYVGMLFAAFCWHNEDNYLYSINYMHWGATKTWYGVPGDAADAFEAVMRASMPELFSYSPDLLYHITTMLSPRRLMAAKVPCYKLNQEPGEYIITFPEAYHGGFSHGFNCCEAVNFATADWLEWGFKAAARYRDFKHLSAFSVTKLLFQVVQAPLERKLEDGLEAMELLEKHTKQVVEEERHLREEMAKAGPSLFMAPASGRCASR